MDSSNSLLSLLASGFDPVRALWLQFVQFVPQLLAALVIFGVGWVAAVFIGALVTRVIRFTGVDEWVQRIGLNERLSIEADSRYRILSGMLGSLVKWVIVLAILGVAADALNLPQISEFVSAIFGYIPNVLAAIVILVIGVVSAQYAADFFATGIGVSRFPVANTRMIAPIAKYAIIVFSIMAALTQLRIVPNLIEIFFAGLVFALALSFGLGGREHANETIRRLREQS